MAGSEEQMNIAGTLRFSSKGLQINGVGSYVDTSCYCTWYTSWQ